MLTRATLEVFACIMHFFSADEAGEVNRLLVGGAMKVGDEAVWFRFVAYERDDAIAGQVFVVAAQLRDRHIQAHGHHAGELHPIECQITLLIDAYAYILQGITACHPHGADILRRTDGEAQEQGCCQRESFHN